MADKHSTKSAEERRPATLRIATARALSIRQTTTLLLLFTAGAVNFFDRVSLSVSNTTLTTEMHWSATQMGWLLSVFSLAYGLSQLPLIGLVERVGVRRTLGVGLGLWSTAQLLTGLARGIWTFSGLRVLLGAGESPFYPCGVHAIGEWFPLRTRARATALMSMSQTLAMAAAPPILTLIMLRVGWRWMFAFLGVAGLLVSVAWMRFYRDRANPDQLFIAPSRRSAMTTCKLLLTQRTVWGMMLGWSGINYTVWLYTAWVPGYLQTSRHLDLATSGWLASIPFLFGALGMASSGFASDFCVRMGVEPAMVYRVNLVVGMPLSAVGTFIVGYSETTSMAVAGISAALFFVHFAGTSGWGYAQIMGGDRYTATLGALMNFASFLFASLAPVMTGWAFDRTHSFTLSLELCGVIMLLGAVSYLTLAKPPKQGNLVDALTPLTRSPTQ